MDLPSSAHFIYIPGVITLGLVLGFIWGAKLTRESVRLEAKRAEEREELRARRRVERQAASRTGGPSKRPNKPRRPAPGPGGGVKSGGGEKHMVGFDFTQEQQQLVATARDFTRKEIIPVAGRLDEEGEFPAAICRRPGRPGS